MPQAYSADARRVAADAELSVYDFGSVVVEDIEGWERVDPGCAWWCTVFVANPARPLDDTVKRVFHVRFANGSDEVTGVALTSDADTLATWTQPFCGKMLNA